MPKKISNPIREAIGSVLAVRRIEQLARDLGVVKRQRKLAITAFVGGVSENLCKLTRWAT